MLHQEGQENARRKMERLDLKTNFLSADPAINEE
jgi:hypothetical protein